MITHIIHWGLCFINALMVCYGLCFVLGLPLDTKPTTSPIMSYIVLSVALLPLLLCGLLTMPKTYMELKTPYKKEVRIVGSLINFGLSICGILFLRQDVWASNMPTFVLVLLCFLIVICSALILPDEYISKLFKKRD